jgi:AraC-like DNA-binding protein/mannose-6-phosphate isomerase-like protein (cupin superfamily)
MKTTNFAEFVPEKEENRQNSETMFFSDEVFSEVSLSGERSKSPHIKETAEIKILLRGEAEFLIENRKVSLKVGDILIIENFVVHSMKGNAETLVLTISLKEDGEKRVYFTFPFPKGFFEIPSEGLKSGDKLTSTISILQNPFHLFESKVLVKGVALSILGILERGGYIRGEKPEIPPPFQPDRIEKVKEYIHEHYDEPITINSAADLLGLHPGYFCRVFKQETGKTFVSYLNGYRISQAKRKLLQKRTNITEIMFEIGFSNYGYFNRVFKQYAGCSPTEYRRQAKDE